MGQKGFYFDMTTCIGCHACQIACRDRNNLYNLGEIFRHVTTTEGGKFPNPYYYNLSIACNHCAKPACVENCPTGAMYKDAETGLVLHDKEMCIGCGMCVQSCPYGEPVLMERDGKTVSQKCDGCYTLVKKGENPVCVDACVMRCLKFGEYTDLVAEYGGTADITILPDSSETVPSLLINAVDEALK